MSIAANSRCTWKQTRSARREISHRRHSMRSTCRATTGIQDDVTSCTARVDRSKAIHTAGMCETVNFERRGGGREASERRFPGRVTSTYAFPLCTRATPGNAKSDGARGARSGRRGRDPRGGRELIAAQGHAQQISSAASLNTEESARRTLQQGKTKHLDQKRRRQPFAFPSSSEESQRKHAEPAAPWV
ncbi:unnamed protein product [Miscanthus lutarioriparius]|uniref:Uncharacterized protein n=1 Tax=Miscanthus lutarioriparius TaxID=422564 RepID=A0A811PTI1_9POAL|nr:unnamed protein product [Miscanthus lutarioriparius]